VQNEILNPTTDYAKTPSPTRAKIEILDVPDRAVAICDRDLAIHFQCQRWRPRRAKPRLRPRRKKPRLRCKTRQLQGLTCLRILLANYLMTHEQGIANELKEQAQSAACLRVLLPNSLMTHENSIATELKVAEQIQEDIPLKLIKFKMPNSYKVKVFKKYHWLKFLKMFLKMFVKLFVELLDCSAATPCS
jgi:hypothetical protein